MTQEIIVRIYQPGDEGGIVDLLIDVFNGWPRARDVSRLRATLEEDCNIRIGNNRTYAIRAILIRRFPEYDK